MGDIFTELTWRGLVHQTTDPEIGKKLAAESYSVYCGFDPSANSLHVGNLMGLLNLRRFQRYGHKPVALAGGGTGFIGDPSGKTEERSLLTAGQLEENLAGIKKVMEQVIDFSPGGAILVNNADWLRELNLIDFLRDVGKHFTVNVMLEKESVRARLQDRDHGISYTEFSYMLLQAYDFFHLYEKHGCRLQVGGSDQFGNITAGCELIRRINAQRGGAPGADGLTWPLLTRSDGKKFGKTEEGAIWLSADRTSPYEFYQYWIRTPDADAGRFLRYFTDLGEEEIRDLEAKGAAAPQQRIAQRALARSITKMVHGDTECAKAEKAASALFRPGAKDAGLETLDEEALLQAVKEAPSGEFPKTRLDGEGTPFLDLMVESKLWSSRGEAKRAVQGGGANLNNVRVSDLGRKVTTSDLLHGKYLVLRKGKKDYFLFRVSS
jgi:tyrosyl-tRNA synthetase